MKENRDSQRKLDISLYSGRPYFVPVNTAYASSNGLIDSIEIIADDTTISICESVDGDNIVIDCNLTSLLLPKGLVLTYNKQIKTITANQIVKVNRTE